MSHPPEPKSLVDALLRHVRNTPEKRCMTFLDNGEEESDWCTYAELDRDARAVAANITRYAATGERVLLLFPPGIDFIRAFVGCLYAGVVAVPAYPPRRNRGAERITRIIADADATCVLTTSGAGATLPSFESRGRALPVLHVAAAPSVADAFVPSPLTGSDLAFLQYTSGSTGAPKGVMVSHGNLLHNLETIRQSFSMSDASVFVGWLPAFHDMGLIGQLLSSLYNGATCVFMAPAAFLQRPVRWLRAMSTYRGTISGAPNSAYELCVTTTTAEERATLDLSAWTFAYNGAEPVRVGTIRRFTDAFAVSQLRAEQIQPCYGMAEAVLLVSVQGAGRAPAFTMHQGRELVGCGHAWHRAQVRIVDPETRHVCADTTEGEIWVSGASIAQGYWNNPAATADVFGARLCDDDGATYYRTGDLGFWADGHLFITGRRKDLIIIRGRNLYPQDVETSAAAAYADLLADHCIAFGIDIDAEEQLVVVVELPRALIRGDHDAIMRAVRDMVVHEHEIAPAAIVLVRTATLPRTSSGKVQRQQCRQEFVSGSLVALAQWTKPTFVVAASDGGSPTRDGPSREAISEWLVTRLSQHTGRAPASIDRRASFSQFALDSMQTVGLTGELQAWIGRDVPATVAYDYPTIDAIAAYLTDTPTAPAMGHAPADGIVDDPIAIVGLACRVPGADTPEAFWALLRDGRDAITMPPPSRDANLGDGGYLTDVARFDAACFGISPHEAGLMDPQQRLLCEVAWEALERAGITPSSLAGSRTGVFVGVSAGDYLRLATAAGGTAEPHGATGNAPSIAANRLSYLFDLRGPSWSVDTACSSSLVAVHQGCESLRSRTSDLALVGGVNLVLTPDLTTAFTRAGMLSPQRRCRTFDAAADGYVRGEGALVFILKRHSDAQRDGDTVWALLRGSAVNQDGRTHGLTAPNGPSQSAVIREAQAQAGVTSADVQLIEAHGTGTALGDPIEVLALRAVFETDRDSPCYLSATKANIGHLEAAAGIAGLCKVVLAMRHGVIPPQVHFAALNPRMDLGSTFRIATASQPWPTAARRLAGVSAFGFGGTNAHIVVEGVAVAAMPTGGDAGVLPLSARTPAALRALMTHVVEWLDRYPGVSLAPLARAWSTTRDPWLHRIAVAATSTTDAAALLRGAIATRTIDETSPTVFGDVTLLTKAEQTAVQRFVHGEVVDWGALYPDAGRVPDAPTYPFEPVPHWLPAATAPATRYAPASDSSSTGVVTAPAPAGALRFGVMFFAASAATVSGDGYRLLLDVARYVDTHGFSSIWLPERHFTTLGGAYPAPAVLHAALAMCTQHVRLQAGSVVAPLHHPVRIVEDWSIVDTLSNGRAGMSLAAGWHPDDFTLAPEHYAERQAHLYKTLDVVRALWRGEPFVGPNGLGQEVAVRSLPRPVQTECPIWITAAAKPESFERAGTAGANLLTHLLDQDVDALASKIMRYRAARAAAGFDPSSGQVTVMIHTFVGADERAIREEARAPFCSYISENIGLLTGLAQSRGQPVDLAALAPDDKAEFIDFLYERFATSRGLIGTPESCLPLVQRLEAIGVNEIACLLDFGPAAARVLESLEHLDALRQLSANHSPAALCYTRQWESATSGRAALGTRFRVLSHETNDGLATAVRAALLARGLTCTDEADAIVIDLRGAVHDVERDVPATAHRRTVEVIATAQETASPLVLVTQGAIAILAQDLLSPSAATIWGVGRALQVEYPGRLGMLLDLDPAMSVSAQAESLVRVLLAPPDEDMVAIRGQGTLVPRLTRTAAPTGRALDVIGSGCTVITGGTGGLGLAFAHRLLDEGVRDIALIGRRPMADADFTAVAARAQALHATVTVHAINVVDGVALHALFETWAATTRTVTAIYHLAGVLDDAALLAQDPDRIARVLAPKVDGAWHLRRLAETYGVKLLVFFSSISSLLPAPGQASYAAANAFLDGLAMEARAAGIDAHSINWGPWAGTGHAATAYGRAAHAHLASLGVQALTPTRGLDILLRVATGGVAPLIVADVDWGQLAASDPLAARMGLLRTVIGSARGSASRVNTRRDATAAAPVPSSVTSTTPASTPASTSAPVASAAPVFTALALTWTALDDASRRARLFTHLAEAIRATLKRSAADAIPPRQPLFDFGLDSILALELKDHLERDFGIALKTTVLFTHPTLEALVDHLLPLLPAAAGVHAPVLSAGDDIEALLRHALESRANTE